MYLGTFEGLMNCASAFFGLDRNKENEGPGDRQQSTGSKISRQDFLRQKRELRKTKSHQFAKSLSRALLQSTQKPRLPPREHKRCTYEAVSHALRLISYSSCFHTGRILVFTNGCPNLGRGSVVSPRVESSVAIHVKSEHRILVAGQMIPPHKAHIVDYNILTTASKYFYRLGQDAFDKGIAIDVFCSGSDSVLGVHALQSLVEPSSGYVLAYSSLKDEQYVNDVLFVLQNTGVSRSQPSFYEL